MRTSGFMEEEETSIRNNTLRQTNGLYEGSRIVLPWGIPATIVVPSGLKLLGWLLLIRKLRRSWSYVPCAAPLNVHDSYRHVRISNSCEQSVNCTLSVLWWEILPWSAYLVLVCCVLKFYRHNCDIRDWTFPSVLISRWYFRYDAACLQQLVIDQH